MTYLFCGDDTKNKLSSYEKFIKSIPSTIEIISINRNDFSPIQIESLYSGSSLFSEKSAVIFSNILEYKETRDFVLEKLKLMSQSNNTFVFIEGKLDKLVLEAFKKVQTEISNFEMPKEKKKKFDNFLIANAFADKDKLNTWTYFRRAVDEGSSMEELIGILFWKIKDMLLKKNFNKFKEGELKTLSSRIACLLPENRKNGRDTELALEQFLLEAF